jgi:hypothetical protein
LLIDTESNDSKRMLSLLFEGGMSVLHSCGEFLHYRPTDLLNNLVFNNQALDLALSQQLFSFPVCEEDCFLWDCYLNVRFLNSFRRLCSFLSSPPPPGDQSPKEMAAQVLLGISDFWSHLIKLMGRGRSLLNTVLINSDMLLIYIDSGQRDNTPLTLTTLSHHILTHTLTHSPLSPRSSFM